MKTACPVRRVSLYVVGSVLWSALAALVVMGPGLALHLWLAPILASAGGSVSIALRLRSLKVIGVVCLIAGGLGLILCAVFGAGGALLLQDWSGGGSGSGGG